MIKSFRFNAFFLWLMVLSTCRADVGAQAIALNCLNCHRDGSNFAETEIPALSRLSKQQLTQALMDFKYDRTQATLMPRIAKGYSDKELVEVAAYLSQQHF